MSTDTDALASYTRDSSAYGPTNTKTVQKTFAQRLRGVLGRINAAIRRGIVEDDIFNLQENTDTLAVEDPGPFQTDSNPQKVAQFVSWLREQLNTEYLTIVGPDRNQWIRKAYAEGVRNATRQLSELDVAFERQDMDDLLGMPIHRSKLQELYTRTYSNLQSVRDDVADDVRDELLTGFREGKGPREIANTLTNRVDSIGKNRSSMIARSEVINAHSEGALTQVENINEESEDTVRVTHGVWDAANDSRVCAFCRALDGVEMSSSEMRDNTVEVVGDIGENFLGQTFRLKPPAHPNGRCNISIQVGSERFESSLDERLPDEITAS